MSPKSTQKCKKQFQWLFFRSQKTKLFHKLFFLVFWCFYDVFGVPRGVIFSTFVAKNQFVCEKVGPSFLHTITAFWLDFQGLGPPGGFKKREKTTSKNDHFFEVDKNCFFY